jgi:hypothetical protein
MTQIQEIRLESQSASESNQKLLTEIKAKLLEKITDVDSKTDEFVQYRKQVALDSENSRTGKTLTKKLIEQLEALDKKKQQEVSAVRLENIKLRNKLRRSEQLLRQKVQPFFCFEIPQRKKMF